MAGCDSGTETSSPSVNLTPLDSGLFRGDLDDRKGLLFFEAHPLHMSLAFDTSAGGVYLAWKGPVDRITGGTGALKGILYHRQPATSLWRVVRGPDTLAPVLRFEGFAVAPGSLEVRFDLVLPDGDSIAVKEYLNHDDHYGDHALETEYHFEGLDSGMAVMVRLAGETLDQGSGIWPPLWSSSAGRLEGAEGAETYIQEFDGVGQVKCTFTGSSDL